MGTNGNKPKVKKISYLIMKEKKEKEKKKDKEIQANHTLSLPYNLTT